MITLIDNYDSFTYNIFYALQKLGAHLDVTRSIGKEASDALIIGPGPGHPSRLHFILDERPVLGICLGHQWLGLHFGAKVCRHPPCHGRQSKIFHTGKGLFTGLPQGFLAARYHSLILEDVRSPLEVTAWTEQGAVMGIAHAELNYFGVQFHPDSVATEYGEAIFRNFLLHCKLMAQVEGSGLRVVH